MVVSIHYIRRCTEFILLKCFDAQCGPSLTNIDLPQSHLCWRSDKDRAVELGDSRVEISLVLHFGMFGGVVEGIFRHCRGDVATNTDYNCVSRGYTWKGRLMRTRGHGKVRRQLHGDFRGKG